MPNDKPVFIVSDLIAKPSILKMYQNNGIYDTVALILLIRDLPSTAHLYYPDKVFGKKYEIKWEIRDPALHESHIILAEQLQKKRRKNINIVNVKGGSEFCHLVKGWCSLNC